jgi:hypothetical protein
MTEPAVFDPAIKALPGDAASLARVVQGLLIHSEWLASYGADPNAFGAVSRATLPVRQRLERLVAREARPLDAPRAPMGREVGTCRDFALMLCSFLRAHGVAARLRCGFASYLAAGWEDHWVCEFWDEESGRWRLADAQLDAVTQAACGVAFDPADVSREAFLTAGEAWLRCRGGLAEALTFGHGDVKGSWFLGVNVVRDAYAINERLSSPWDRWREAARERRDVTAVEAKALDRLAENPEDDPGALAPPWLSEAPAAT